MTPYRGVDSPALATRGHGAKRGRKVGWVRLRGQGDRENGTGQGMRQEASVRPVYHVHAYAHHPHPLHPQRTVHCPSCTQPPKCHFADDAFLRVLLACLHVHNFRDFSTLIGLRLTHTTSRFGDKAALLQAFSSLGGAEVAVAIEGSASTTPSLMICYTPQGYQQISGAYDPRDHRCCIPGHTPRKSADILGPMPRI